MKNYISKIILVLDNMLPGLPPELLDLYVNLVLSTGTETTLENVHDAWSIWKNRIDPTHKSLIPFQELTPEVQELDRKYMNAIRSVALDIERFGW